MFSGLGLPELLIILVIVMLLFGAGRVSQIGKELGSAIGSIRKGMQEDQDGAGQAGDGQTRAAK